MQAGSRKYKYDGDLLRSAVTENVTEKKREKTANVWKYFKDIEPKYSQCQLCKHIMVASNTDSMRAHLVKECKRTSSSIIYHIMSDRRRPLRCSTGSSSQSEVRSNENSASASISPRRHASFDGSA